MPDWSLPQWLAAVWIAFAVIGQAAFILTPKDRLVPAMPMRTHGLIFLAGTIIETGLFIWGGFWHGR